MPALPAREVTERGPRPMSAVIATFGGIGLVATLCYFVLANMLSGFAGLPAVVASVCAYLVSAAFSYYGHKYWSFASKRAHAIAVPRFLASAALGLALAYFIPLAGRELALPATAAYIATCIIVPLVNFFVLGKWVFGAGRRPDPWQGP